MLGFAAIAEVALAEVPEITTTSTADTGLAWRRWWLHLDAEHFINRDAPHDLVWRDDEEAMTVILLSGG